MPIVLVALVLVSCIVYSVGTNAARAASEESIASAKRAKIAAVSQRITQIIATHPDDRIGVAVQNTKTGEMISLGSSSQFEIASTEKVLSAAAYYRAVEKGQVSLDTKLGAFPAWFQLKQMITQSNNDSWNLINDELGGTDALQIYANSIGIMYEVGGNLMSPGEMTKLLTKLSTGQLLNKAHTDQLLSYMQHTNEESMLPSALPADGVLFHKYGELGDELHDVGIVTRGSETTYSVAIYTTGKSLMGERTAIIQSLAKEVYQLCGW